MFIRGVLFFVLNYSFLAVASNSFVCPERNIIYNGVTCCLEAVSEEVCKELVDQLPPVALEAVATVQNQYQKDMYAFGRVPNCFWGAAVTTGLLPLEDMPMALQPYDLIDLIAAGFIKEVPMGEGWTAGDLLLFEAHGGVREDVVENNIPKRVWIPYSSLEHAAVYLGSGLLFQKENIGSAVFSIDSVENTQKVYEKGWNKSPQYRGQMLIKALR